MALKTVRVSKPGNRLVYINGNYTDPAGNSSTDSFTVPTGGQIFETLNSKDRIDYRKEFDVSPRSRAIVIELDPVNPPEKP